MEANELRIGNLLMFREKKIVEVSNLGNTFETVELVNGLRYGSDEIEDYSPIPINEDFLIELGFEKHSTNPYWFRSKQICISLAGSVELISWDMQIFKIDTLIYFVHELQNLSFSLNGTELKLSKAIPK